MLKGHVFSRQLFENQIFALFINTFLDGKNGISNNYKNGMAVSYSGSDVTIASGAVCIQGRFMEEDSSTTLSTSTDNAFCKLVVEIDLDKQNTDSNFEQGCFKIITSTTGYPALTQNNIIKNNAGIYQYELARFKTSVNGISDFQDKRTFIDFQSIYDEIEQHIQDIDDGTLWLLKTGGEMTGPIIMQTNSLNAFIHNRNINDVLFRTRVGTGQNYQDGTASLELSKNGEVLGKLDVRADGKIYNGKTAYRLIEESEFIENKRDVDEQFSNINTDLVIFKNKFKTLTASRTIASGEVASFLIEYPTSFSKDNSVLLSKMYSSNSGTSWNGVDHTSFLDFDVIFRSMGIEVRLQNNSGTSQNISIKLAIMKE